MFLANLTHVVFIIEPQRHVAFTNTTVKQNAVTQYTLLELPCLHCPTVSLVR